MNTSKIVAVVIVILAIIFFLMGPYYIVEEGELAIVTRFGKIIKTDLVAGLKFKMPIMDEVQIYPKRIQSWDGEAQEFPTQENQLIWVDITARWKIQDPKLFFEKLGTLRRAQSRLDDVINSSARKIIANHLLREAVRNSNLINEIKRTNPYETKGLKATSSTASSSVGTFTLQTYDTIEKGRVKLSEVMFTTANETTKSYGIQLIDVIIRQIKYTDQITKNVFDKMVKERNQIAQAFRSQGEGAKADWVGRMEKKLSEIRSTAERTAKEKKAEADAKALEIRNAAYNKDPDFADFWMALVQYQKILPKMKKILTTDMEFFKFLYKKSGNQ